MNYFPWFDVETIQGDTAHLAALSVVVINDEPNGNREIYLAGVDAVVKTKLPAHEIFERMSEAIGAAREAELEAAEEAWRKEHALPERDPEEAKGSWERSRLREVFEPNTTLISGDDG